MTLTDDPLEPVAGALLLFEGVVLDVVVGIPFGGSESERRRGGEAVRERERERMCVYEISPYKIQ